MTISDPMPWSVRRRSQFRLDRAQRDLHIREGLLRALDMIDEIIATIRSAPDRGGARDALMNEPFEFSELQAEHILNMQLARLTRLARTNLESEIAELRTQVEELTRILGDEQVLLGVIKTEIGEIRDRHATPRKSTLEHDDGDLDVEDLIDDEDVVVVMTARGYIKTVSADSFRTQGRGGRGVAGAKLKDEDYITDFIHTSAHAYLLFFSNRGKVYRLKVHRIPMKERNAQGTAVVNLLRLSPDEKIQTIIDTRDYETHRFLLFVTREGIVKKTRFTAYDSSRQDGLIAVSLRESDELVKVLPLNEGDDVVMVSAHGKGIRFNESDARAMGRNASGVRGMRMRDGDRVVGADVVVEDHQLLTVTDAGFGKRTDPAEFARQRRGGQGVRAHRIRDDRGRVLGAFMVAPEDDVFLISDAGVVIRTPVSEVRETGRDALGVKVMRLDSETHVAAIARVIAVDEDDLDASEESEGEA